MGTGKIMSIISSVFWVLTAWKTATEAVDTRLPPNLEVENYDLYIEPRMSDLDTDRFHFEGNTCARITCLIPTDKIVLHMSQLQVSKISLEKIDTRTSTPPVITNTTVVDWPQEFLILDLSFELSESRSYKLCMDFKGVMSIDHSSGFILDRLPPEYKYRAVTQFMPTNARRVFPCFDEPALKATYNVKIFKRSDSFTVISNKDALVSYSKCRRRKTYEFKNMPKMSTYSLAFVICDFASSGLYRNGFGITMYRRTEAPSEIQYVLEITSTYLKYFGDFLFFQYPFNKMDLVSLSNLGFEGQSHLGVYTMKEETVMLNDLAANNTELMNTHHALARGLARVWFGNIVSPQWWDMLWLTEGLAVNMEYMAVASSNPTWRTFDKFTSNVVRESMRFDQLAAARALATPVQTSTDILDQFNEKRLLKGAAIIRMLCEWLGDYAVENALRTLVTRFESSTINHTDVFDAFNTVAQRMPGLKDHDFRGIMSGWINQNNYPLVFVNKESSSKIRVTSKRFVFGSNEEPAGGVWHIPFTYTTGYNPDFENLSTHSILPGGQLVQDDVSLTTDTWIVANVRQVGYYRVVYDADNWAKLIRQLNEDHTVIHPANRAQILDDAWTLATSGYVNMSTAMSIMKYLSNETDFLPWNAAKYHIDYTLKMLYRTPLHDAFKAFIQKLVVGPYKKVMERADTWKSEVRLQQKELASIASSVDETTFLSSTLSKFRSWRSASLAKDENNDYDHDLNPINPEFREAMYCAFLRKSNVSTWYRFYHLLFQNQTVPAERKIIRKALACTTKVNSLIDLMNIALGNVYKVPAWEGLEVMTDVLRNPYAADEGVAWDYVMLNWRNIYARFNVDHGVSYLITMLGQSGKREFMIKGLEDLKNEHAEELSSMTAAFDISQESIRNNIRWMQTYPSLINATLNSVQ